SGSQQVLEELERRQIFTTATDDRGGYRYHEVLRSHLEQVLMEELGEIQAQAAYRRAGMVLEAHGAFAEAVQAFSRGEDWEAVDRLLHHQGGELLEGPDTWIDALPPALLRQDPWLMLGSARRHRAEGRWREAIDAYQRAERVFGSSDAGLICAAERKALAGWLEPAPMPGNDWAGLLRKAVAHDPLAAKQLAAQLPEATGMLTIGVVCLLAGQLDQARAKLNAVADSRQATPPLATAARLWAGVAALLGGDLQGAFDVEESAEDAEALRKRAKPPCRRSTWRATAVPPAPATSPIWPWRKSSPSGEPSIVVWRWPSRPNAAWRRWPRRHRLRRPRT